MIFDAWIIGSEIAFSTIIIILCFVIYAKTKEMFKLTKHKGIAYFRQTFLFMGLAYLFRFISSIIKLTLALNGDRARFFGVPFIFVAFFSTLALMTLFMSVSWKNIKYKKINYIAPIIAFIILITSILFREPSILMTIQVFLLVSTAIIGYNLHGKSKNFKKLSRIYVSIFLFWILSLSPLSGRKFMPTETILIIHTLSLALFLTIFYKVHKWIK